MTTIKEIIKTEINSKKDPLLDQMYGVMKTSK